MRIDAPTAYARSVAAGDTPAGVHVRESCERHLRDLKERRHWWDPSAADRFAAFAAMINVDVDGERVPMQLEPWQWFIIGSLLGWKIMDPNDRLRRRLGTRRFRYGTLQTPKGAGKSPLLAALGLFMLTSDGYRRPGDGRWRPELAPDCFAIASTREQATEVVMRPMAQAMHENPAIAAHGLRVYGGSRPNRIVNTAGGAFEVLAGKAEGSAGRIVQFVVGEELHEWENRHALDAMTAGFKRRHQPMCVTASNAGKRKHGVAWEERQRAVIAARGDGADTHFSFICELPEDAERERDERGKQKWHPARKLWPVANPSLGSICDWGYIENQIDAAKVEGDRREVNRLNFGIWPGAGDQLLPHDAWKAAEVERADWETGIKGPLKLFVGLDLGMKSDLTAVAYLWVPEAGPKWVEVEQWLPDGCVANRDATTDGYLREWAHRGFVFTPPGAILDYADVAARVLDAMDGVETQVTSDPYRLDQFCEASARLPKKFVKLDEPGGIEVRMHPQGYYFGSKSGLWMEASIEAFQTEVLNGGLKLQPNPVLRWNHDCAVVATNAHDNRQLQRPEERRRSDSIDGLIAAVMACGLWELDTRAKKHFNPYNNPEFAMYPARKEA